MVNFVDVSKFLTNQQGDKRSTNKYINPESIDEIDRYKIDNLVKYSVSINGKSIILVAKTTNENAELRKLLGLNNEKEQTRHKIVGSRNEP